MVKYCNLSVVQIFLLVFLAISVSAIHNDVLHCSKQIYKTFNDKPTSIGCVRFAVKSLSIDTKMKEFAAKYYNELKSKVGPGRMQNPREFCKQNITCEKTIINELGRTAEEAVKFAFKHIVLEKCNLSDVSKSYVTHMSDFCGLTGQVLSPENYCTQFLY